MHDGDRGKKSKTRLIQAGIAATLLVIVFTGLGVWSQLGYHQNAANNSAQYERWSKNEIRTGCVSLGSLPKAECAYQAKQAAQENKRAEYDLYAQRTSALWAGVMAVAALVGIGLSGVGVLLVKNTFDETKNANDLTKMQMLPVIDISEITLFGNPAGSGTIQVQFSLKFIGQNRADDISVSVETRLFKGRKAIERLTDKSWLINDKPRHVFSFAPNLQLIGHKHVIKVHPSMVSRAKATVTINYTDVFGRQQSARMHFLGHPSGGLNLELKRDRGKG